MDQFIFLDNWVFSRLVAEEAANNISAFVSKNNCKIITTSSLFAELYNPKWEESGKKDRCIAATKLLSEHPAVAVDPLDIISEEYRLFPDQLDSLPVRLDYEKLIGGTRFQAILNLFRRGDAFLMQGRDLAKWQRELLQVKQGWLTDVNHILENATRQGYLEKV
jgi:hypothetical protein